MNADDARLRALVDYMALELDGIEKRMTYASDIIMEQDGDDMAALSLYLRDAAAHGGLHRIRPHAHPGGHRSEIPGRALLPVHERGGGFCKGPQ